VSTKFASPTLPTFDLRGLEIYDIDLVDEIKWEEPRDRVLDKILIDNRSKDIVKSTCRSAVSRHNSPNISTDWISGKGAGQVFLFHGT